MNSFFVFDKKKFLTQTGVGGIIANAMVLSTDVLMGP